MSSEGTRLVPFEVTYAGRTLGSDGKVRYRYEDSRDGGVYSWQKALVPSGGIIGAVYEVNEVRDKDDNDLGIRIKGEGAPRYLRSLPYDDSRVIAWKAEDERVANERARTAALRKAGDPFDEVLRLVREASVTLTRDQRRALAVRLMESLWLS